MRCCWIKALFFGITVFFNCGVYVAQAGGNLLIFFKKLDEELE